MANTIIKYVKQYGDYTFCERPMNDVDSLVLCQICYLKFDGMVPYVTENRRSVSIRQLAEHADYEKMFSDERFERDNRALFTAMLESRRYRTMKLNCYINIVEPQWETQFSAVTCLLEDGTIYIAFRGTDETIIGWKEDFNMAFLSPVPGQAYSVKYVNMVTSRLKKNFYLGGHSKGGNLAIYSAMNCLPQVQGRILKIYNMDGPGFRPEVMEKHDYGKIQDKVIKILPHSSVVGMLFEKDTGYKVVESRTFGLLQHNPFTWLVEEDSFVYTEDVYERRKFSDTTLNEWILSLDEKQLKLFVDTLFQVVSASQVENLIDLSSDWKRSVTGIINAMKEVDEETVAALRQVVKSLVDLGINRIRSQTSHKGKKKTSVGPRRKS